MIRDRKMYVAPTPFSLTQGTAGHITLILPAKHSEDERLVNRGDLTRIEADQLVVGYRFDLRTNDSETIPSPDAGTKHNFVAYRPKSDSGPIVTLTNS